MVSAGEDRVVNNQAQTGLVKNQPTGELVTIAGSYHEIVQETPTVQAAFWELAEEFLARAAREAG